MTPPEHADMMPFDDSAALELLGEPVSIDEAILARAIAENRCSALAFDLYKEALTVVIVASHISTNEGGGFKRSQAICVGLMVRIAKFMTTVLQLTAGGDRREVVLALSRSILESAVNLRFLLHKNRFEVFDAFVRTSLAPERELFDVIKSNIADRGGTELPIETRMLDSIEKLARLSGLSIKDVSPKRQEWAGSLRDRMKAIGEDYMYLFSQRLPSHAVHGSWVDLLLHHLDDQGDAFVPDSEWKGVDARLLNPIALVVLQSVEAYLEQFYGTSPDVQVIRRRLVDLNQRISKADQAHETWMQGHSSPPQD
jgi:hypothetical protein